MRGGSVSIVQVWTGAVRETGRGSSVMLLAALFLVVTAAPASADPARPTNYRSEVTGVSPAGSPISATIIGGDAFLWLEVEPGVQATVAGYGGEPYIRFDPDGAVWVNTRSPAHYLNDDRYAQSAVPADASVDAEPRWELVTGDGTYGWHDHRIHWMAPAPPPGIQTDLESKILDWAVLLEVNGVATTIEGTLTWFPSISPLPWILLAATAAAAGFALTGVHRLAATLIAVVAAGSALIVGGAEILAAPSGAADEWLAIGPPATALVFGILSVLHPRSPVPLMITGVLLGVWGMLRVSTLWMPELPTELPASIERAAVAIVGGVAIALVVAALRSASAPPVTTRVPAAASKE
jgi:hypothetical protein